jgi:hypothetical protein
MRPDSREHLSPGSINHNELPNHLIADFDAVHVRFRP